MNTEAFGKLWIFGHRFIEKIFFEHVIEAVELIVDEPFKHLPGRASEVEATFGNASAPKELGDGRESA